MSADVRIAETTSAQRKAADPAHSAFVSANAGAGKTKVLTERVARLLLADADPAAILCITFTKAAAAEMSERLFRLLGGWALADDESLAAILHELDGDEVGRSENLPRARRLFAQALETPGGLKIQTIHAFCESVLKRFPLEADAPPGFQIIDALEAASLARAAVARVAAQSDDDAAAAFALLLTDRTGGKLRELLEECVVSNRRKFARADEIGWESLGDEVADALGIEPWLTRVKAAETAVHRIERMDLDRLRDGLESGTATTRTAALKIDEFRAATDAQAKLGAITPVFLKADGEKRQEVLAKGVAKADPALAAFAAALQDEIAAEFDRIDSASALEETRALFVLLERCFFNYQQMKSARAALDFDDLVARTTKLLAADGGAAWVLYKLDKGLAHILLDEGQDTGPDAWNVIESPLCEFFAGDGAAQRHRTFFAVGDQKQSIYSFQGADAALFKEKEADLSKKIGAAHPFEIVPLKASFRSSAPILAFIDRLFEREEVIDGVSADRPLEHFCTRDGAAGRVELWPLTEKLETERPALWDAPLDATSPDSPPKRLAAEVAKTVACWLKNKEILESRGRPIEPGDIMILVQTRGERSKNALFVEMIRALSAARVPVAGADKIMLMQDQAVLDLVSYARAVLYGGDDLSLAETLKSPFFNLDENGLYELANGRESKLWTALRQRKDERVEWSRAYDEIAAARATAIYAGPVDFLSHVLETGAPSGWRRLASRLGHACREPLEELLRQAHNFELRNPRSLRLFLDAMRKSDAEVWRESSEAGDYVRVMTVHKAKGLEANIVFLLDGQRYPVLKAGPILGLARSRGKAIPLLVRRETARPAIIAAACDRERRLAREEYRRLLYVGATRARDRLYICGYRLGNDPRPEDKVPAEKSWHALSVDAFAAFDPAVVGEKWGKPALRIESPQTAPVVKDGNAETLSADHRPFPECLKRVAPPEARRRRVSPSELLASDVPAFSPRRGVDLFTRGRVLHRLLEILPDVEPAARRAAADRMLARHAASFSAERRAEMREEAMRVLEDPAFAPVFAPGSFAEAAVGGTPEKSKIGLFGRIDRLAITQDRVLIVDYKTNRPPPKRIEDISPAYLAQMAAYRALLTEIYPDRTIEAALLWTYDARLMILPADALDRAQSLTLA